MVDYPTLEEVHGQFLKVPEDAETYLQIAVEDYEENGDVNEFLCAVRDVAKAQGGMTKLAKATGFDRAGLYKALSENGNPRLDTLMIVLRHLGFQLTVKKVKADKHVG